MYGKKFFCSMLFTAAAILTAAPPKDATIIRLSPMPKAPSIDGKLDYNEWQFASTSFGGVSNKTGLLTQRENDFRVGYDAENLYFSVTSEIPTAPQMLNDNDFVEVKLIPPGGKETVITINSEGKGKFPAGTKIADGFAPALMNSQRGNCWILEFSVPLASLGVSRIADGKAWKMQMARHWSNVAEVGYWHYTPEKKGSGYGSFIPDADAPAVSFDGFGYGGYEATGNYLWTFRVENSSATQRSFDSASYMVGISGAPTLDINNPNLVGKAKKIRIGYTQSAPAHGKTLFQLYMMAQFAGKPRLLHGQISKHNAPDTVYYQRSFFWDTHKARNAAIYRDDVGLPYLNAGFYPSFGNKVRMAASFNRKLPIVKATIEVKDSRDKILWQKKQMDFGRALADFECETSFPDLPLGDYRVILTSVDGNGKKYVHTRTFSLRKFPWQNLNLGTEKIIIPPFKPLQLDKNAKTVKALLTGYKIGGKGLWSEIYAEGENILASPVVFYFNGEPVIPGEAKLISAEADRIVYESTAKAGGVTFTFLQDYDYDGFCKVTIKAVPQGTVQVRDFSFRVSLKNDLVKFYNGLGKSGPRAGNAPDLSVRPGGDGDIPLPGLRTAPGQIINYFWFGGSYKGFCWMTETYKNYSLDRKKMTWKFYRANNAVTFDRYFVNKPTEWSKPLEWVVGFEPTPVKPRNEKFLAITEWMYSYPPAKGSIHAGMIDGGAVALNKSLNYPMDAISDLDNDRWFKFLFSTRDRVPSAEECAEAAKAFFARNKEALDRDFPLFNQENYYRGLTNRRQFGRKYFLRYMLPTLYSYKWPEAEMYKAEWLPWDYPVDEASNEYIANRTKEHTDFQLYYIRNQVRIGYDGINFDTFPLGGGFNQLTGNAVRTAPGKIPYITAGEMMRLGSDGIVEGRNLFGWRELMKRTATLLCVENKLVFGVPWLDLHTTEGQCVPCTAFCSTVINWERSSGGDEFQRRYPEGFILADTAGTQSGIVSRTIVHTHSPKLAEDEQVKTLLAISFGYGLMNHVDQGVSEKKEIYQQARDLVFSFGYGRPENKTIPFYSRTKQPVTCDAKDIRMTQVVRPDGHALLMIGNMGEAVKAKFDLSGLHYTKGVRITDLYSGLTLAAPELEIPRHGCALLEIENAPSYTAAEVAKKNKLITGEDIFFNTADQMTHESPNTKVECKDGVFSLHDTVHFWSKKPFRLEDDCDYVLSCEYRKTADVDFPSCVLGAIYLTDDGKVIPTGEYMAVEGSLTTLAAPIKVGDTTAVVNAVRDFRFSSGANAVLAFNAKADGSDIPNREHSPYIKELKRGTDKITVIFKKPADKAYAAGLPVRLHYKYNFYTPVPFMRWTNRPKRDWQKIEGKLIVPHGVHYFRPAIIFYDYRKRGNLEVRNLKLTVKSKRAL